MSEPETPRERALRLWEAAGYAHAAVTATRAAAAAAVAAYDAADDAADDALVAASTTIAAYDATTSAAYEAGQDPLPERASMSAPEGCVLCVAGLEYATVGQLLGVIELHHVLLRAERERADRLEAALGEIAETLGELARYLPELRLDEKAEARAEAKEPEP